MNADLFWQWSVAPGGMIPIRRNNRFTMTDSNGGGYLIIWDRDRVAARGGAAMINRIWSQITA